MGEALPDEERAGQKVRRLWARRLVRVITYGPWRQRGTEPQGGHEATLSKGTNFGLAPNGIMRAQEEPWRHEERLADPVLGDMVALLSKESVLA